MVFRYPGFQVVQFWQSSIVDDQHGRCSGGATLQSVLDNDGLFIIGILKDHILAIYWNKFEAFGWIDLDNLFFFECIAITLQAGSGAHYKHSFALLLF